MKFHCNSLKHITWLFVIIFVVLTIHLPVDAKAATTGKTKESSKENKASREKRESEQFVSIDFNDVDISVFIKFISELTKKNFVVDKRVRGKVTIISPAKISVKEAFKVFESVLEVHGFTAIKAGEIIKIIPSPDARSKNIETILKEEADLPEDKIVTQLIPLMYADPTEIKRLFAPFISKSSVVLAYPPTNMLIVTDVYSNIKRLLRILKAIDVTGIGQEIAVIHLEYADATKFIKLLDSVFQSRKKPQKGDPGKIIKFVADERTNTIVVLASETDISRVKKLIRIMDKEVPKGKERIRVFYLENASAEELAKVLQTLSTKQSTAAKRKTETPVISGKIRITADKSTNSLIILAEKEDYIVLEEIIKKLDIPRAMVYIESLIMEVNTDKDFNLGTEWLIGDEGIFNDREVIYGGGFSGGATGGDSGYTGLTPTDPSTGIKVPAPLPPGFSMGVFGEAIELNGIFFPSLGAVIQAYEKDRDIHILSTPQILTTDNQEATITVGKNIPYQTQSTAVSGVEAYSSYEYRDIGITLKITPQISKDRKVRLDIEHEIKILESTTDFRPTTLQRTVNTTVIVKDKNTVVIGGLIQEQFTETEYKVPCLGDIPLIGWLFKSIAKAGIKSNLYIFLTPHIIESPAEAEEIYIKKKDQIDNAQEEKIKLY
jgi:general secretion pathway protein D